MSTSAGASPGGLSQINGTMPEWSDRAEQLPAIAFVDSCLRGVGQVCFMNNPITGLLILVAMCVGELWLGFAGALGLVVSTAAAIVIGMDRGAIRAGLYGFNGVLVGAGLSLFLQPDWDVLVMVWIVVGAFFSTILHAALANVFLGAWAVPPFTLAFNFITLIFLIGALNFANGRVGGLIAPADAQVTQGEVSNALRSAADAATANNIEGVLNAVLRGISQLFFANSIVAGIIIIVGIAVCSRIAAVFALVGLRGRDGDRVGARRKRRRDLQRPLWVQFVRCRARRRRRVLRAHVALGPARGRLRSARGDAVRGDRVALHSVGAARPDPAVLLRDAGVRAAQGHDDRA